MTSRERLLAAIRHDEPDRVPVSPRISYWLMEYYGHSGLDTYLRSVEEFGYDAFYSVGAAAPNYIESVSETYNLPGVKVEQTHEQDGRFKVVRRVFHTPEGKLSDTIRIPPPRSEYGMSPNAIRTEHLVRSPGDLPALRYLFPPLAGQMKTYHETDKKVGDRGLTEVSIPCAIDYRAGRARGVEQLMMDYFDDRPFFDRIMNLFHERVLTETKYALEHGVKVIFGHWFWASLSVGWSPAIFQEVFVPQIREHVELVHRYGALYHYYDDGRCAKIMGWLKECGVDIFSTCTPPPVGDFDLAEQKKAVGDRICLKGYVDLLYVVKHGTAEMIDRTVREAMEIGKPRGGFILGSSDSFREGTPIENIRAYFEAGRKYGRYSCRSN